MMFSRRVRLSSAWKDWKPQWVPYFHGCVSPIYACTEERERRDQDNNSEDRVVEWFSESRGGAQRFQGVDVNEFGDYRQIGDGNRLGTDDIPFGR